jgi:hypothetical protein
MPDEILAYVIAQLGISDRVVLSRVDRGLLGPLRGRPLVKDTLCWSSYQQDMAQ